AVAGAGPGVRLRWITHEAPHVHFSLVSTPPRCVSFRRRPVREDAVQGRRERRRAEEHGPSAGGRRPAGGGGGGLTRLRTFSWVRRSMVCSGRCSSGESRGFSHRVIGADLLPTARSRAEMT